MNNKDFCELFYKQTERVVALTEDIYKRYQFAVASIALLGGVVGAFSRGRFAVAVLGSSRCCRLLLIARSTP